MGSSRSLALPLLLCHHNVCMDREGLPIHLCVQLGPAVRMSFIDALCTYSAKLFSKSGMTPHQAHAQGVAEAGGYLDNN